MILQMAPRMDCGGFEPGLAGFFPAAERQGVRIWEVVFPHAIFLFREGLNLRACREAAGRVVFFLFSSIIIKSILKIPQVWFFR
ncbi:MAG TPA: hypothetical protein VF798_14090, partial [Burkholderiaceae bacterium]